MDAERERLRLDSIEEKIFLIRGKKVLLDYDVATLYGVETKRINEAVKNNPDKFPAGYFFALDAAELEDLRSKISTANLAKTRVAPKAFTEKGLYMLATVLKSSVATQATIKIIETFAKLRELSHHIKELSETPSKDRQKGLMQRSGKIIAELLDDELQTSDAETTFELNFAVLKFRHTVKKKRPT